MSELKCFARLMHTLAVGLIIALCLNHMSEQHLLGQKKMMADFTARHVAPYNQLAFKPPRTMNEVGNHLVWVACMQSAEACTNHPCLVRALGGNETAVAVLCAHVKHDCSPCPILESACIEIDFQYFVNILFFAPCAANPLGDHEYANKILAI